MVEDVHLADTSTMMLGARAQTQVGALKLGLNGANLHVYQSTQPGNSLKGIIRPTYPRIGWLGVRFSDDSPVDGKGGAVVQDLRIIVNGVERPDITNHLIRHNSLVKTAVGSISSATGNFRPLSYRGRSGLSFYADYLYRIQHEQGIDVSANANVELLENTFVMHPRGSVLQADGEDWVIALYDLREVPVVEEIEIETLVANDYRIDVFFLTVISERAKDEARRWSTSSWINRLRAPGNIQDLSNLERVRFSFGETTGLFAYSADAELKLRNLEIKAEYARSAQFSRYPSYDGDTSVFRKAPHSVEHGCAYYVNATRSFKSGVLGAVLFALNPEYKTRMFSRRDGVSRNEYVGVGRSGMFTIDLVEDNDDGDQMSENGHRPIGTPSNGGDLNGVFLNQDVDNDGIPDTNRNFNGTPDWDEPFFMFDADPNEYAYGLDRNNNDEPDQREDDGDADYPYDADQRGFHLFGQLEPTKRWSVGLGRYQARQIAGPGRNQAVYGLVTYRRRGQRPGSAFVFREQSAPRERQHPGSVRLQHSATDARSVFRLPGLRSGAWRHPASPHLSGRPHADRFPAVSEQHRERDHPGGRPLASTGPGADPEISRPPELAKGVEFARWHFTKPAPPRLLDRNHSRNLHLALETAFGPSPA